ncbi:TRAP transporter substrate-binding protein DctP [Denitromonas sp.]|uniref:TRAP transporter substrate-binding protein DctP n=1 Tax=Denitromonas sp. TaxID=2734609 RepID=UPI003A83DC3B
MNAKKLMMASLAVLVGTSPLSATAADKWIGYTYSAVSTTAAVKGIERVIEKVQTDTGGALSIKLNLGKTLQIGSNDITQAVGDGIVQFAADGFFLGSVPIGGVLRLPQLINSDTEWKAAVTAMEPYLKKGFEKQGAVYLGQYRYPEQVIFTNFKIESLADLQGKKIRVTSPEQGEFVKTFGGLPLNLPGTEVPTALERGVVDGVITASAGGAKNWHEFLKYNYRFGVNYFNSAVIANKDAFDALPEKAKSSLVAAVKAETDRIDAEFAADEIAQMESQKKSGMTIVGAKPADASQAAKKLEPYWSAWAKEKGPEFVEALKAVRSAIGK